MTFSCDFSQVPMLSREAGRYPWQDHGWQPLDAAAPAADGAALLQAFSQSMPGWANRLMRWRNRLVAPLGLKTGTAGADAAPERYQEGQRFGVFRILHLGENAALLGQDDAHLDVRLLLQWRPGRLEICTLVRTHNLLGKCYMALVTPWHYLIDAACRRRMAARLNQRRT
ncbi:DUF2867 domain-containing protein [Chromobacterium sp. IIBBL 290-4]|uniref:DUF2867 domain-containing protein n=1 Tax=Chromobacterium sp. IIBBL 290-4 TaxID=2953890 RepID=UPI0020B66C13|nr:DUF2867 domain-containing protein [Chromobacterium sp. IIBBL 290-4]UTH75689.1 DUF2867 domain-containing protein [Chromobacterium sp. IIBBL 290-4]